MPYALGKNDVKLLNSAVINEFTMLTYRRPLARDDQYDTSISTNQSQAVIWAMGPINSKVNQNLEFSILYHPWVENFITHPTKKWMYVSYRGWGEKSALVQISKYV